jgi:hypothetical protein
LKKLGFETAYTAVALHGFLADFEMLLEMGLRALERRVMDGYGIRLQFITPDYVKDTLFMVRARSLL